MSDTTSSTRPPTVFAINSSERPAAVPELSNSNTHNLEKLSRRSPNEVIALKALWEEVHGAYVANSYERKTSAFQDAGALLTLSESLARQVLRLCLGTIPKVKKKGLSLRNDQWEKAKVVRQRIKEKGEDHAKQVMQVWTAILKKSSASVQPQTFKDVGLLMQMHGSQIKILLEKLDVIMGHKKLAANGSSVADEDPCEQSAYATGSPETVYVSLQNASIASARKARPRTRFANGLGKLGIDHEAKADESAEDTLNASELSYELSTIALKAIEKLSSHTPAYIKALTTLWKEVQGQGSKEVVLHDEVDELSLFKDLSDFLSIPEDIALILSKKLMRSESSMGSHKKKLSQAQWEHLKKFARTMEMVNWPHFYAVDRLMKAVVGMRKANKVKAEHVEELCGLLLLEKKEAHEVLKLASVPRKKVEGWSQTEMAAAQALVALSSEQAGQDPAGNHS